MAEIICAIHCENFEEVECIVAQNPENVHITNWNEWTPLDVSIAYGRLEMAQFFWEKDGQPNREKYCDGKWTPVHCAVSHGHTETLEWAFDNGVLSLDVLCVEDDMGKTPLGCAIERNQQEIVVFLLEQETAALLLEQETAALLLKQKTAALLLKQKTAALLLKKKQIV